MTPARPGLSSGRFKLLAVFERVFLDKVYKHRNSSIGNNVAIHLYEDLIAYSTKAANAVLNAQCVVNVAGSTRGVNVRRGDGTFGRIVPHSEGVSVPGFAAQRGMVALTHVGAEVKIIATSHLGQIDRVMQNLEDAARGVREKSDRAISVGIAAVNYSEKWTGFEGDRQFPVDRSAAAATKEADDAARRIMNRAAKVFDEFLLLRFKATNREPYPFAWLDAPGTEADYGALLVRVGNLYEARF